MTIPTGRSSASLVGYDGTNYFFRSNANAGETNTASNLGGGLPNFDSKSGVDLRFNTYKASDFDITANLVSIDYSNGQIASSSNTGFMQSVDYKRIYTNQSLTPVAGAWTYDVNAGGQADVAFSTTGGRTLAFSNQRAGDNILLRFNNTSGSSIALTLPANSFVDYSSSSSMTIPTGRSSASLVGYDGTNYFFRSNANAGETNTASNLGGGLANFDSKSGLDLRFNTFKASDFDIANNLISIDYANAQAASSSNSGLMQITDYKRAYSNQSLTPAAGTWTFDVNAGGQADVTFSATGGRTLAFSNQRAGDVVLFRFNNTSGSAITLTLPANSFVDYNAASTMTIPAGRSPMSLSGYDGTNYFFQSSGSSGEINTASNLGGGLPAFDSKSGVDLRFNSFKASDFDVASNLVSIDYATGQPASSSNAGFMQSTDYKRAYTTQTLTPASGAWTYDVNAGGQAEVTFSATGGRTLAFSNQRAGDILLFRFNNTSGSSITITLPANSFVNYASATTLVIPTGRSSVSLSGYTGTNYYFVQSNGTYATNANKLNFFAATASSELSGVISDETGSGSLVFGTSPTLTTPNIGAAIGTSLTATGAIKSSSSSAGIGYTTGAGNAIVQLTSKTTGVTINNVCGKITTHNATLSAGAEAKFTVTNSAVAATDVVAVSIVSNGGSASGTYIIAVTAVAAGSFDLTISNVSALSPGDAIVINFAVIKSVIN